MACVSLMAVFSRPEGGGDGSSFYRAPAGWLIRFGSANCAGNSMGRTTSLEQDRKGARSFTTIVMPLNARDPVSIPDGLIEDRIIKCSSYPVATRTCSLTPATLVGSSPEGLERSFAALFDHGSHH